MDEVQQGARVGPHFRRLQAEQLAAAFTHVGEIRRAVRVQRELVNHAGDVGGHARETQLAAAQGFLRLDLGGDVRLQPHEVDQLAALVENRIDRELIPEGRPVLPVIAQRPPVGPSVFDRQPDFRDGQGIGLRSLQETAVAAHDFGPAVARDLRKGGGWQKWWACPAAWDR